MTTDEFRRALTKDKFKPCRLLLRDGQEIHLLSDAYGLDQEGTLLLGIGLTRIRPADVERLEPLPYRVCKRPYSRGAINQATKVLAVMAEIADLDPSHLPEMPDIHHSGVF